MNCEGRELLDRRQVAARLGVSAPTVRRLEGKALHAVVGPHGAHLFDAVEVERLARERAETRGHVSQVATRAFALFASGRSERDVVIALRMPADLSHRLYLDWKTPPGRPSPVPVPDHDAGELRAGASDELEMEEWTKRMKSLIEEMDRESPGAGAFFARSTCRAPSVAPPAAPLTAMAGRARTRLRARVSDSVSVMG